MTCGYFSDFVPALYQNTIIFAVRATNSPASTCCRYLGFPDPIEFSSFEVSGKIYRSRGACAVFIASASIGFDDLYYTHKYIGFRRWTCLIHPD
jgi:hypothetical protein